MDSCLCNITTLGTDDLISIPLFTLLMYYIHASYPIESVLQRCPRSQSGSRTVQRTSQWTKWTMQYFAAHERHPKGLHKVQPLVLEPN
jgi:hypothetical protein